MNQKNYKIIHDGVHGAIKLPEPFLSLVETPEAARLRGIKQLGLANLVYPGANHSRFEHSIGAGYVARKLAAELNLSKEEENTIFAAGLLHDIGHNPFSHTLESTIVRRLNKNHMDTTSEMILGKYDILREQEKGIFTLGSNTTQTHAARKGDATMTPTLQACDNSDKKGYGQPWCRQTIYEILKEEGISPEIVSDLITGKKDRVKRYMAEVIHGRIDADQIDYLLRDAHYTGVAYGAVDASRLFQTLLVVEDDLAISRNGIPAAENLLTARALMYSSVYFHKTVRIAELMLQRAFERIEEKIPSDINVMTDCEFSNYMLSLGGLQAETMLRIKYRRLYKAAYSKSVAEIKAMGEKTMQAVLALTQEKARREFEDEIAAKASLPAGSVIVDLPHKDILINEPRLHLTDIPVYDGSSIRMLSEYSPLAKALQLRVIPEWGLLVACPPEARKDVAAVVKKGLEG